MTPAELLASLRSRGFALRAEGGRLLVSPRGRLTGGDVARIRAARDAILALVAAASAPPADADAWEATAAALADRAWRDEPDWSAGGVALRESTVLRLEGFPPVAVGADELAMLDALARHNRQARDRRAAGASDNPRRRRHKR